MKTRAIPIMLLLVTLACFVPAWFRVELGGRELIRFTGTELVFGTRFSSGSPAAFLGDVRPRFGADIAACACVLALLLSFVGGRRATVMAATSATLASAGLMATGLSFPASLKADVSSVLVVRYALGYYLAVLGCLSSAVALGILAATRQAEN
jgi:hypothetical protein